MSRPSNVTHLMDHNSIRKTFLDFFAARDHTIVPSASLIPVDPTLLLTSAGMVPFKPYMLGEETPPYLRAASIQKCARTTDIDIVGTTARHLTFFEMLGNFSFGDYFKEKAIPWAYELVTEGFGLDPDRLWYTVHITDDEAAEIWIDSVGIDPDRLQRLDKDNFWQMGVAGPCGPSSEIFYDKGPEFGEDGGPEVDDERFMEFWNLVFMQNIQDEPYHVVGDLPAKNIDTGAGLDRLTALLQGHESVFETDLIRPIIAAAENATGSQFGSDSRSDVSLRILGDHGKAVTFLIGDGVVPSNEGRGYVLRRLLRRAVRHAQVLGTTELIMPKLVAATTDVMGQAYPALASQQDMITEVVSREETQFRRTLDSGHQLLDEELGRLDDGAVFPGETAFKLHDTYGFPRELTEEILAEQGIALDLAEFERMMQEQKKRSRAAYKGGDLAERTDTYRKLLGGLEPTDFLGYSDEEATARLLSIVREGDTVERASEGESVELFLDRTPFYAESGGQVGDAGIFTTETGTVRIADTRYAIAGVHGHFGKVTKGHVMPGQDVQARVDGDRRERIRKNHSGTHVLHWALRDVIGDHAHQAGSLVAPDRLRFDFSHHTGLSADEILEVERVSNARLIENHTVQTIETTKDEAETMGALAFFGDKYGAEVRVVQMGDFSTEFCGGTHVRTTGQVGPLILVSEGSVAANTRRVEALTGLAAYEHLVGLRTQMHQAEASLRAQPGGLVDAASAAAERLKAQEHRLSQFQADARTRVADTLMGSVERLGDVGVLAESVSEMAPDELRVLATQLRDRLGSGVGIIGAKRESKAALVAFVSADLIDRGLNAGELLQPIAKILGGGGGRDPELAQAGGPHGDKLAEAVEEAGLLLRKAVSEL